MRLRKIGEGITAFPSSSLVRGRLKVLKSLSDLRRLKPGECAEKIVLVPVAGVAGMTIPLMRASGIICTTGGVTSHLAILAREFRIPCIMGATIEKNIDLNDGRNIVIDASRYVGEIYIEEA